MEGGPGTLVESLKAAGPVETGARGEARRTDLVGRDRAADMAINVVLPTMAAWARGSGNAVLEARCRHLYTHLPALQENALSREARRLAGNPGLSGLALDACMQQGLLHLYRQAMARFTSAGGPSPREG